MISVETNKNRHNLLCRQSDNRTTFFLAVRLFFLFRGTLLSLPLFSSKTIESVRQHNCVLRFAVSDLIPLDFVRFQMKVSACTVADIDRRVLRLVGVVDNAVLAVFHIGVHFNIIVG